MANKIIHKRSSVVTDGVAKLPKSSELEYGELAINFGSGAETISLKNSNDEIIEFKSNNYYEAVIKENEFIIATALTDLDDRTTALENFIQSDDFITKEDLDNKVDNDVFDTYTGSTATNAEELTNRLATLESVVEDNEFVTAGSLSDLNKRITNVDEKVENCVSNDSFKEFTDTYEEDERVVAAAFTDLDDRTTALENFIQSDDFITKEDLDNKVDNDVFDTYTGTTAPNTFAAKEHTHEQYIAFTTFEEFKEEVNKDARVIAAALTDLDDRTTALENFIQSDDFITKEDLDNKVDNDVFDTYTGSTATNTEALTNRLATLENVVEDNEFVTAGSLSDLNKRITNVDEKIETCTSNDTFNTYTGTTAPDTFAAKEHTHEQYTTNTAFEAFADAYEEDELVIAAAFTTLDEKVAEVGEIFDTYTGTTAPSMFAAKEHTHEQYTTNTEFEEFQSIIDKDNLVVATSLTDLNNRMICVEGADKGKSIRQIANEELSEQLIADNAQESLDTLKEISEWIQEHPEDAAAMNEAIASKVGNDIFQTYTGTTAPNTFAAKEHTHEQYTTNTIFEEFKEEVNKDARVIATALTTLDTRMKEDNLVVANSLTDLSNRLEDIANNEYYDDGSGKFVPIKHPDLSTQPNILPYKFMGEYVYEILLPIPDIDISKSQYNVNASQLLDYVEDNYAVTILQAEELLFCYKEDTSPYPGCPMFIHRNISIYTSELYGGTSVYELVVQPDKTFTSTAIGDVVMAYLKITYTSMPKEGGDYYGYNNY